MVLEIGGYLNILIAFGHLIGLYWAKPLFRYTGIEKEMNKLADIHPSLPYLATIFVAIVFTIFGLYGLSATGKFYQLPYLRIGILIVAGIYLIRGLGGILGTITKTHKKVSPKKEYIFSSIASFIGILYLIGWLNL